MYTVCVSERLSERYMYQNNNQFIEIQQIESHLLEKFSIIFLLNR